MDKPHLPPETELALKRKRLSNAGQFPPSSIDKQPTTAKRLEAEEIERKTAEFLARGGEIEQVPDGESNYNLSRTFTI